MNSPQALAAAIGAWVGVNAAFVALRIWAVVRRERRR